MIKTINYTAESPEDFQQVLSLYKSLGWNSLNLTVEKIERMCNQSWYVVYAYADQELVGMARVISDGVITGVICGVGVSPQYQSKGIGTEMMKRVIAQCEQYRVIPQLMCVEKLEPYYESLGFQKFSTGMVKKLNR
ncbi:GNAT family N-acetyltransferase [Neobacillus kokaensis]|uniref:N-acetyltransferase n=1 Tax=Neobacillus kokaensis TaxID=2759023 RepID=A0ABQ3N6P8_9BACI|nr:GNAT family N-acetyltransferase [Neobacillus kokaensis]GHI00375.1 N-acetyltransferase [Neobacillus kokaensis]